MALSSRLAALACVAACFTLASAQASGSGSGSDDLLTDEGDASKQLPAGNGEAPPAGRVAQCFQTASNVSEFSVETCDSTWVGVIQGARAACLDATGSCKDEAACASAMGMHSKSLMELCRTAQDEYHPENVKDCLSGFDNDAVDALIDPDNYYNGDIKHHADLLEIAAKCNALPKMEMVEDAEVTTYTDLRKVLYQACTEANPNDCAAQKQALDTALVVQKYTETSRIVSGQVVSTAVLCSGKDPKYEPADINKCKLAEMVVTRAGLEHCQPDCGMAGQRPCAKGDHSHGVACRTPTCVDYLNYLSQRHFDIVETDCSDARFAFNKLTTTCPGPRLSDTLGAQTAAPTSEPVADQSNGGRRRRQDKNAKNAKNADKKNSDKNKNKDPKGDDELLLDDNKEGENVANPESAKSALQTLDGSTVGPATPPVEQGENRPVFLHGKDVLSFVTLYLAEQCGATTSNVPQPSAEFMFLYQRIVKKNVDDCHTDATKADMNPDSACASQELAQRRLTTVQRVVGETGTGGGGSAATTLKSSASVLLVVLGAAVLSAL